MRYAGTVVCMWLYLFQVVALDCGMVRLSNGIVGAQVPRDYLRECIRAGCGPERKDGIVSKVLRV